MDKLTDPRASAREYEASLCKTESVRAFEFGADCLVLARFGVVISWGGVHAIVCLTRSFLEFELGLTQLVFVFLSVMH